MCAPDNGVSARSIASMSLLLPTMIAAKLTSSQIDKNNYNHHILFPIFLVIFLLRMSRGLIQVRLPISLKAPNKAMLWQPKSSSFPQIAALGTIN